MSDYSSSEEGLGVTDQLEKDLLALLNSPIEPTTDRDNVEFSQSADWDAADSETPDEWAAKAKEAYALMQESVSSFADESELLLIPQSISVPSLFEMVSETIRSRIQSPNKTPVKTLAQLQSERDAHIASSTLPSFKLQSAFANSVEQMKALKFQLPQTNQISQRNEFPMGSQPVVSVQIYRKLNSRETKILEINFPLSVTLVDLFNFTTDLFPETRMWDGPQLVGSGLIIIGNDMFTTGDEDYSLPYSVWLTQIGVSHTIRRMESVTLGQIPQLLECCEKASGCFIQFCGSEILKMYFTNLALVHGSDISPKITYKRKLPRPIKCILCKTRAATLIIVNDVLLPQNPSHCCNSCYRRLRSDRAGDFVMPPDDVVVSEYCTI
jgi:hypothetical protein